MPGIWIGRPSRINAVTCSYPVLVGRPDKRIEQPVSPIALLTGLWEDLLGFDKRLKELDAEIALIAETDPVAKRLQQLRGVGPIIATAMVATVGNATQFANGRQMAAALGLTPRQNSSGGKERLLGISKRGDAYMRRQFINGARALVRIASGRSGGLWDWINALLTRRAFNVVTVAVANKLARIAWALQARGTRWKAA